MLIKGNKLAPSTRAEVLSAFIYRHTLENESRVGQFVNLVPATQSDEQWLADHAFHVRKSDGKLMLNRRHAEPAFLADTVEVKSV